MDEVAAHDAEELDRLVRFATRPGREFGLALLTYADYRRSLELLDAAWARIGAAGRTLARVADLEADDDLAARIADASADADVVFVTGIEPLVRDGAGRLRRSDAIVNLNLRRDALPGMVSARVVFCLAKDTYPMLAKLAWDLLEVMLTRFEFLERQEPVALSAGPRPKSLGGATAERDRLLAQRDEMPIRGRREAIQSEREPSQAPRERAESFARRAEAAEGLARGDAAAMAAAAFASAGDDEAAARWHAKAAKAYAAAPLSEDEAAEELRRLAETELRFGDGRRALQSAEQALQFARSPLTQAQCWGTLADLRYVLGDYDEALRIRKDEQIPRYEALGRDLDVARCWRRIAEVHALRGDADTALDIDLNRALPVFERHGERFEIAATHGHRADILAGRGELDEALRIRRELELPVYEEVGAEAERAVVLAKIASILAAQGQWQEALAIHRGEVLPVFEARGDLGGLALAKGKIADILAEHDRLDEAIAIRREQLEVYARLGLAQGLALARFKLAEELSEAGSGERAEIEELLEAALAEAERLELEELSAMRERAAQLTKS